MVATHVGAGVLVVRLLLTALVALASGWCLNVLFAFSSMTGVSPSGGARWWGAALDRLYLSFDPGIASWPLSALLLLCGYFGARSLVALLRYIACRTAVAGGPAEPGAASDTAG
ncbi:hypothetical protein R5W23_001552 [Gemmata sp. JC673]|uniref:DUF2062 domain-containing protein n=1 Tax=Gemmata algarum TaxID=2975278 RepID=A0ABU5EYD3_9BACT|nr:hypothetical protein [Gemmata algarum]MDY3560320.1 hypothetical protein [Gemmata algarum]